MLGHVECSTGIVLASSAKWSASCLPDISVVPAFQAVGGQIVRHRDPSSCVSRTVGLESVRGSCALRHAVDQVLGSRIQQSPFCACKYMHSYAVFSTVARVEATAGQGVVPGVNSNHLSGLVRSDALPCACAWHVLKGPGSQCWWRSCGRS